MQVSDVGFNVHRERERGPSVFEQHRWSMPIGCFESLCWPARLVLPLHVSPVQLAPTNCSLAQPERGITASETTSHILHAGAVVVFVLPAHRSLSF